MAERSRMAWIDVAKGISIVLVVMMYAAYNTGEYTGGTGFLHYVIGFATPFRMPEFFLIAGLFLSRVIDRPWRIYADRRVIHYLYFYGLWMVIDIVLKVGIVQGDAAGMLQQIAKATVQPYGVLWFIYMLAVFSLVAKLLRQIALPPAAILIMSAVAQMSALQSPSYVVTQFAAYFVFFYVGAVAAPLVFRIVEGAEPRPALALGGLVVWLGLNGVLVFSPGFVVEPMHMTMGYLAAFPPVHLALALIGAIALCVAGALLAELPSMDWLRWLGEHSLVIYVSFTIPMSLFRELMLSSGILTETGPLSMAVLVVSLVAPVLVYLAVRRTGVGAFLFQRPDWAHIAPPARLAV
ncbi:acyltransferase [Aureimonas glaciei]|uniref:Acyltransferase n=2 Tax=Aureimonas glaciei TaxID=1776957 RepID=A0A916XYR6_9HYPH|nr:acyltransferase [Aureimonas glaciei]